MAHAEPGLLQAGRSPFTGLCAEAGPPLCERRGLGAIPRDKEGKVGPWPHGPVMCVGGSLVPDTEALNTVSLRYMILISKTRENKIL